MRVIALWLDSAADRERVEVIVGLDRDYQEGFNVIQGYNGHTVKSAINGGPFNCVGGWNAAATGATGDVLIAVADDFVPPQGWDRALERCAPPGWWEQDRVVQTSDGYNPDLMTLAILTKRRYDRFGYIFYPGYHSLFSDTEFTFVARQEQVVIDARHLLFEHMHPDCGKRPRDGVDLTHASKQRWQHGEQLFNFRQECGFPLDAGPVAARLQASYDNLQFAAYVQAIRDDFCLYEVIDRVLVDERIKKVFVCSPDQYWNGQPRTEENRKELVEIVHRLNDKWVTTGTIVYLIDQPVQCHRVDGRSRIMVETAVRNAALEHIRKEGFEHIVVLDGDELWEPGLMQRLVDFIQEHRPRAVFTGMVPVIGLPGYPVEGALDKATIYVGPQTWFVHCRGTSGHRHELPSHDVMHFTATRRTRDEIAAKMFGSGHADDPKYAFAEWVDKVLPNIRPGFRHRFSPRSVGLHMYLDYNVWPCVRPWKPSEWAQIPDSVKPYLAAPPALVQTSPK